MANKKISELPDLGGAPSATDDLVVVASGITKKVSVEDLFTNIDVTGTATFSEDASIHGLTVGLGNGSESTNTAVGLNALRSNNTGSYNSAFGLSALRFNTSGSFNSASGINALYSNIDGNYNSASGANALLSNISGNYNSASGANALYFNTTGSYNTASGVGALRSNIDGNYNSASGSNSLYSNIDGSNNTASGRNALYLNTSGSSNSGFGVGAGSEITTGSKNTILGRYNGNQGGLDIRTANNHIVLSDGDGNPRVIVDASGNVLVGKTGTSISSTGIEAKADGQLWATRDGNPVLSLNRKTSDGSMAVFYKDGTTVVGSIGVVTSDNLYIQGNSSHNGLAFGSNALIPFKNSAYTDNVCDIGGSSNRFKDLYLSGGVYLGGTGAANLLDDYETGTFIPTVTTAIGTISYSVQQGSYLKIGDVVHYWIRLAAACTESSTINNVTIPFSTTAYNDVVTGPTISNAYKIVLGSGGTVLGGYYLNNQSAIRLHSYGNNTVQLVPSCTANTTFEMRFEGSYRTA